MMLSLVLATMLSLGSNCDTLTNEDWPQSNILVFVACKNEAAQISVDAGNNQDFVALNSPVTLTAVVDTSGDPEAVVVTWTQIANGAPTITLTGSDTLTPSFTPTLGGLYRFRVNVTLGLATAQDDIEIGTELPTAIAFENIGGPPAGTAIGFAHIDGDNDRLFVVDQDGRLWIYKPALNGGNGGYEATPYMDIRDIVNAGGERGFLGAAFDPDYATNGVIYVNYTGSAPSLAGSQRGSSDGTTRVAAYGLDPMDPDRADLTNNHLLLSIAQPFSNHNGGQIDFGADGMLYIGTGDGGSSNDPNDAGQNIATLLGKMLRIQTNGIGPYSIPADNPFVGSPMGHEEEIWALGLRNPWRFSFDRATGDLFIGDVGQSAREEIDWEAADDRGGHNYGWRVREGNICTNNDPELCDEAFTDPIHDYNRSNGGCSVIGGFVYRGTQLPILHGVYIYTDLCDPTFYGLVQRNGTWINFQLSSSGLPSIFPTSFGEDNQGEMYLSASSVYKIIDAN